jgi:hypothetical protein
LGLEDQFAAAGFEPARGDVEFEDRLLAAQDLLGSIGAGEGEVVLFARIADADRVQRDFGSGHAFGGLERRQALVAAAIGHEEDGLELSGLAPEAREMHVERVADAREWRGRLQFVERSDRCADVREAEEAHVEVLGQSLEQALAGRGGAGDGVVAATAEEAANIVRARDVAELGGGLRTESFAQRRAALGLVGFLARHRRGVVDEHVHLAADAQVARRLERWSEAGDQDHDEREETQHRQHAALAGAESFLSAVAPPDQEDETRDQDQTEHPRGRRVEPAELGLCRHQGLGGVVLRREVLNGGEKHGNHRRRPPTKPASSDSRMPTIRTSSRTKRPSSEVPVASSSGSSNSSWVRICAIGNSWPS